MALDALQLEDDRSDEPTPGGNLYVCGAFHCLTVTRTVHGTSYTADAFRQKGNLVVIQLAVGDFLDAAMVIKTAIITADDLFAFDEQAKVGGLFQYRERGRW